MAFFSSLQQYVDTITARLIKPVRGVSGSEGVTNYDVLEALTSAGERMQDAIEFVTLTNSTAYIQGSIAQAAAQVTLAQQQVAAATTQKDLAIAQANLAATQRALAETARADTQALYYQALSVSTENRVFKDSFNPLTNSPDLTSVTKATGDYYKVSAVGTTTLTGGSIPLAKGDELTWNGTKWVWTPASDAAYQKAQALEDRFRAINEFDKSKAVDGYFVRSDAAASPIANATYAHSDYISVTPGNYYGQGAFAVVDASGMGDGMRHVAFYNASMVFVPGGYGAWTRSVTIPAGVAFVRISFYNLNINSFQFVRGTAVPAVYVPYVVRKLENVQVPPEAVQQDNTRRFVSDTEKTAWSAKLGDSDLTYQTNPASRNKLDKSLVVGGSYVRGDAAAPPVVNATYAYSDYIPVVEGNYYGKGAIVQPGSNGLGDGMRHVAFYNASKVFVPGGYSDWVRAITIPAGVAFVRISFYALNTDSFQFEAGNAATSYVAYSPQRIILTKVKNYELPTSTTVANPEPVAATPEKLTLGNADKILITGCSYEEGSYSHRGKTWVNKLAQYTDWMVANAGVSGQRMIDIADRLRKDTATYLVKPSTFRPSHILLGNNGNEFFPASGENLDLYEEQFRIAVEAVQAWGAKPIFGTNYHVNSNKYLESGLKAFADRNQIPYMGIGLNGSKIISQAYQGFWSGSHPGTRTNAFQWQELLYFIDQMPRPRKGIKIFRPRATGQTPAQLNYDTIDQRVQRWIELNVGEKSLNEANSSEAFYDRLNEGTTIDPNDENNIITSYNAQSNNNEYAAMINGTAVNFTDYALIELIIDRVNPDSFQAKVTASAGLSFYVKNNNDPAMYESALRDTELVFQVSEAVYNAFADAVGTKFTSAGVKNSAVQFAYTGKLKSHAMGKGWFLCFSADSSVAQGERVAATTVIARVTGGTTVATLSQKVPYRYGYSYFAGMNKPKGSFQPLTTEVVYASGVYTITLPADSRKYFQMDKIKLLAVNSGAFTITGVEASYTGGRFKPGYTKPIEQKPHGTELIATRGFDANWTTTGGWTDNGNSLVSMPSGVRDYPPFLANVHHVELGFDTSGFPRKITRTITLPVSGTNRRGWQKAVVRVVARLFPPVYNTDQTGEHYTNTPQITKTSYDLGMICLGFRANGSSAPEMILRRPVDVGWSEVTFETTLPIMEGTIILDLWRDGEVANVNPAWPMQVYDVSFQVV